MSLNIDDYLVGIVIGIRFRANFKIEDQLGRIVDKILYSDKSAFNPTIFPHVRGYQDSKILYNEKTRDQLHLNNSNLILELNLDESSNFAKEDINKIVSSFKEQIIEEVLVEYDICKINRLGFIKKYFYKGDNASKAFIEKTLGNQIENINEINLSYAKKITSKEALLKKDISDYDNVIFNLIKKTTFDEIFISIDYQSYFDPFLEKARDIDFDKFMYKVNRFDKTGDLTWIENRVEGK